MGLGPESGHSQVPDVRWGPVIRCLMGGQMSGGYRSSTCSGSDAGVADFQRRPVVRSFDSGVGAPVVRFGPNVRSLGLG